MWVKKKLVCDQGTRSTWIGVHPFLCKPVLCFIANLIINIRLLKDQIHSKDVLNNSGPLSIDLSSFPCGKVLGSKKKTNYLNFKVCMWGNHLILRSFHETFRQGTTSCYDTQSNLSYRKLVFQIEYPEMVHLRVPASPWQAILPSDRNWSKRPFILGHSIAKPYIHWKVMVLRWHQRRVCEAAGIWFWYSIMQNNMSIQEDSITYQNCCIGGCWCP